ncbi:MAG: 16S rRNA (uracil(1498)-N(3))-methyltransferase [Clostridia bacterium]|nr:16S rRNA (uracil(1498)-N(3))-methyltransferase [Clostridia bacterium]
MPRFFVKSEQVAQDTIYIVGEDVKHIKNVLRKQVGDILEICNQETGKTYKTEIFEISESRIENKIIEEILTSEDRVKVDIYQGLPKADKMELIIQKSIELGVNAIIPVEMKRCVVKLDSKSESKKIERWQKIAESAAKQSGRNIVPQIRHTIRIQDIVKLKDSYDSIIVCYENEKDNYIKNELLKLKGKQELGIAIVIGPEGGLEEADVEYLKQNGAAIVTLGDRILRTETVALNLLSIIMYELEN